MELRSFVKGKGKRLLALEESALDVEYPKAETDAAEQTAPCIAVLNIRGPLEHHAGWWFDSFESIQSRFQAALDCPDVAAVVLKIDSPGGDAAGNIECARAMTLAKEKSGKTVWTFSDESAYSAAYAIACVADKIFLPESAGVGSIGCLCVAADMTEMAKKAGINAVVVRSGSRKAEGHPLIPLDDATLGRFQTRVDSLAQGFAQFVSEQRGVPAKKLLALQGACFYGKDAVSKGLANGVMSFDAMMAQLGTLDAVAQHVPSLEHSGEENPMTLAQLQAALKAAHAAGDAVKVASLQAKITAKKAEEADEDEEEEKADDESKAKKSDPPPAKKPDEDGDDDDDDEEDDEEEEEPEEEEEETKKTTTVKTYRRSKKAQASLGASVAELFPGLTSAQIRGRLAAMQQNGGATEELRAKVKQLEANERASKVEALIKSGRKAGKITKAQEESLRTMGMKRNGINELRAFLDATPARVTTAEDGGLTPSLDTPMSPGGVTVLENTIATRMGVSVEQFTKQKAQMGPGLTGIILTRVPA